MPGVRLLFAALLSVAAGLVPEASAHRLKESLTTVEVNDGTGLVEVMHRFYVHDADHAVGQLGGMSGDLLDDGLLRVAFARYVAQNFTLADAERTPLDLRLVGVEIEGRFLWVYQEMPGEAFDEIAWVGHSTMQDVWSDQVNQVNVKSDDHVRTLYLHYSDDLVALEPFEDATASAAP